MGLYHHVSSTLSDTLLRIENFLFLFLLSSKPFPIIFLPSFFSAPVASYRGLEILYLKNVVVVLVLEYSSGIIYFGM